MILFNSNHDPSSEDRVANAFCFLSFFENFNKCTYNDNGLIQVGKNDLKNIWILAQNILNGYIFIKGLKVKKTVLKTSIFK